MKRIIIILIVVINMFVLTACIKKPNHNCEIIKIDGAYENFKLEENAQYAFYSTYDHNSLVRYDKSNREKVVINLTYDHFTISEEYIYFSKDNNLIKCDLDGNVLFQRTITDELRGLVYDKGYLYFVFTEMEKEDRIWETSINYIDEDDFLLGNISSKSTFSDETIKIYESYLIWSRYLYSYKNNVTYTEKNSIKYLYNDEVNYNYDKITWPELKQNERRSYPIKHKIYGDDLYLTFYTYTGSPHIQNYTCYTQYRDYTLIKYNFVNNTTEVIFTAQIGELILNFNQDNVYIYRNGDIVDINLKTGNEKKLGLIDKIENIEGWNGASERVFISSDFMILHFNSTTSTIADVIFL